MFYFAIKPETVKACVAESKEKYSSSAGVRLLMKFVQEWDSNEDIRRRFKAIGLCCNLEEMNLPSLITTYNGKPVIIYRTGTIFTDGSKNGGDYLEMDIKVRIVCVYVYCYVVCSLTFLFPIKINCFVLHCISFHSTTGARLRVSGAQRFGHVSAQVGRNGARCRVCDSGRGIQDARRGTTRKPPRMCSNV